MDDKEAREKIKEALKGNRAWWSYPGKWSYDMDDYIPGTIALDGRFTLQELEKIVSVLRRAEVRGETK